MLLSIILLPIIGSLYIFIFAPEFNKQKLEYSRKFLDPRVIGIIISSITFLLSLGLWYCFDNTTAKFQYIQHISWLPVYNIDIYLGVDGISLFFILLTTLLIPLCLLASWNSIKKNISSYVIAFLILETFLILVFSVLDLLLFYICFESVLIPMFLVIGIWGSRERKIKAGYYFFLYTLFGSVFMLLGIMVIYFEVGSTNLFVLMTTTFSPEKQLILFLSFFIAFASKIPMFPMHIWLPEAHVEAPTAGSVLLAGLLLKLGGYGFLRFSIPLFPYAAEYFTPFMFTLSVIGIIYASLTTLRQIDLKRIIAYSSIAHMNFVMLGLFSLNQQGLEGAVLLMLGHGLVSSALFLIIGVIYDRHHTRLLVYYGGLTQVMPIFSIFFLFFTLGNIAMPGTSNFVGEFLILAGLINKNLIIFVLGATGMVLGAAYSLWLYNRVAFGDLKIQYLKTYMDVNRREWAIFLPLIFLTLLMGIYPEVFLKPMHASISCILENNHRFF